MLYISSLLDSKKIPIEDTMGYPYRFKARSISTNSMQRVTWWLVASGYRSKELIIISHKSRKESAKSLLSS